MLIFGLILAGGEARRLDGADKALLSLGDQTLLSHVTDRFAPQVAELALSANGDPARFKDFDGPILPDADPSQRLGPMAGLLAGLTWARARGASHLATASVDTPFLPCDMVAQMVLAAAGAADRPAIAKSGGRAHPTCALWPCSLETALATALASGERRIGVWADSQGAIRAMFQGTAPDPFFNINSSQDLAQARTFLP